jgi:hypothetical protein
MISSRQLMEHPIAPIEADSPSSPRFDLGTELRRAARIGSKNAMLEMPEDKPLISLVEREGLEPSLPAL